MGQQERFDVIVVGARGSGPQAVAMLGNTIERRLGIALGTLAEGIAHGGVEVHKDVAKSEAITLARTLQELGAIVDVRSSRRDAATPLRLEPDVEASASPPAPPPYEPGADEDDRDLVSLVALDAEPVRPPRPQRTPTGEVDSSRPQGQPVRVEPERPFDSDRKPRRASSPAVGTPRASDSQRVPMMGRETPASGVVPPTRRPEPRPTTPSRGTSWPPPRTTPAAARRPTSETATVEEGGPLEPAAPVITQAELGAAAAPPRFAPPQTGAKIELDIAAAGLAQAPVGTSAIARGRGGSEASGTRGVAEQSGTMNAARSGGGFPSPMEPQSSTSATRMPVMPPPSTGAYERGPLSAQHAALVLRPAGLLATDRVTSGLLGAALAAVVGLAIAYGWVRRDVIATSERLEGELRESVADPIGVDEGRVRAPQAIADELGGAHDEQRTRYLQIWALFALPIGAALGLLKRGSVSASA